MLTDVFCINSITLVNFFDVSLVRLGSSLLQTFLTKYFKFTLELSFMKIVFKLEKKWPSHLKNAILTMNT